MLYVLTVLPVGLIFVISWSVMDGIILFKHNFKDNFEGEIFFMEGALSKTIACTDTSLLIASSLKSRETSQSRTASRFPLVIELNVIAVKHPTPLLA